MPEPVPTYTRRGPSTPDERLVRDRLLVAVQESLGLLSVPVAVRLLGLIDGALGVESQSKHARGATAIYALAHLEGSGVIQEIYEEQLRAKGEDGG